MPKLTVSQARELADLADAFITTDPLKSDAAYAEGVADALRLSVGDIGPDGGNPILAHLVRGAETLEAVEVARILEKVKAEMPDQVQLVYAGRGEELTPEQVRVLLKGENPWEADEFSFLEDAECESRYEGAVAVLKDILTEEEFETLEGSPEQLDEARGLVEEHDESDLITDIHRETPDMLIRYDLEVDVDTNYASTEREYECQADEILGALGFPEDHPIRAEIVGSLLPHASYGGRLWLMWSQSTYELEKASRPYQTARHGDVVPKANLNLPCASLLVLDRLNGSGFEIEIEAPYEIVVPFDPANLTIDTGPYSWSDIAGGVSRGAYAADAKITPKEDPK